MAITLNGSTGAATGIASLPSMSNVENKIIQVVSTTTAAAASTHLAVIDTWYDVPGMTCTITTTGTNKVQIDVIANCSWYDGYHYSTRIVRTTGGVQNDLVGVANGSNGSGTIKQESFGHTYSMSVNGQYTINPHVCMALDNPGAGTHTYKLQQISNSTGYIYLNDTRESSDNTYNGTAVSSIRLMEVPA